MPASALHLLEIERYIDETAAKNGLTLTPAQRERVIAQFVRSAEIALPLINLDLPDETEATTESSS